MFCVLKFLKIGFCRTSISYWNLCGLILRYASYFLNWYPLKITSLADEFRCNLALKLF